MTLSIDQAQDLASHYFRRRDMWPAEDERTAFLVVILNYGDHLTKVTCVGGEWEGVKGDLSSGGTGIPHCPNGHVLFEGHERWRLGLVEEDLTLTLTMPR